MQAGLEALAGEGRQDVVTLVRRDPLLQSPHPGLGRDLSYDTRHLPHTDYLSVSLTQCLSSDVQIQFYLINSEDRILYPDTHQVWGGEGILLR